MMSPRLKLIRLTFTLILSLFSVCIIAQNNEEEPVSYDTSGYIPIFYKGALDYNLMIAASQGYIGEVNRLIMKGADIFSETDQGVTALIFAITNNKTQAAKMLLDYGSDPNKYTSHGESPLIIAVKNQNAEITEALIRAGAEVDSTDHFGATPLHYASAYDFPGIADMLIYYDASVNSQTKEGTTPLLASVWAGNADAAELLIQHGANPEIRDKDGFTPLLMAAMNGDTLIMQLLIKKGANLYSTNNSGQNALTLSIIAGNKEATAFLLNAGKNWPDVTDKSLNPYAIASKYRRKDIIELLKSDNIPGKIKHEIDQVGIAASGRFSFHDIYTGISLTFKEPFLDAGIILGYDTKLWYTRVLIKQNERAYYQYFDKGSVAYAGVFKDFPLTDYAFKGNLAVSGSLFAGYRFGDDLKGTFKTVPSKIMIIPALSLKWSRKDLYFSTGFEYMNTGFYHTGPIWFRVGAGYNLYFDNVRTKGKTLRWY